MAVTQISVDEPQRPPLRLVPPEPAPIITDQMRAEMVAAMAVAVQVLGARLILLLVCIGAFTLGLIATMHGSTGSIVGSAIYDLFVLVPTVLLAWRKG
jgi:hypothetical protein